MRHQSVAPGHVVWTGARGRKLAVLAGGALCLLAAGLLPSQPGAAGAHFAAVLLGLALVVGSAVALLCTTEIELSPETLLVARRRPWGGPEWTLPRSSAQAIRRSARAVVQHTDRGSHRRMVHTVELRIRDKLPPGVSLCLFRSFDEIAARLRAEQFARAADLPCEDAVGDEVTVRAPDRLDGPPAARSPLPAGKPPAGVELHPAAAGRRAAVGLCGMVPPGLRRFARPVLRAALAVALLGLALVALLTPDPVRTVALPAVVVLEAAGALLLAWALRGCTRIGVEDAVLRCRRTLSGVPLPSVRVPVAAVEQVRPQGSDGKHVLPGVALLTDRRVLVLGRGLDADARRWLGAWLEAELWPELPVAGVDAAAPAARGAVPADVGA